MKGILTYYNADNYGAVLQAYALQQALLKFSCRSELISFAKEPLESPETEQAGDSLIVRKLKEKAEHRHRLFQEFRDSRLTVSKVCSREEMQGINEKYDSFITGSDQVWNPEIPEFDMNYFLPFAEPRKRYSYAASFGCSHFEEQYALRAGQLLSEFREISVREETACRMVKELSGSEAHVDLDPVLLRKAEEWETLVSPGERNSVFLYMLVPDPDMEKSARDYAASHGKKLIPVTGSPFTGFGFDAYSSCRVEDWISRIYHADAVFTNSFHGAVLSLLFGRPLFLSLLKGNLENRNLRFWELFRIIRTEYEGPQTPVFPGKEKFELLISKKRQESLEYLQRIAYAGDGNRMYEHN